MAENLAASGVTDITQVGKKSVTNPGSVSYTEAGDVYSPETTSTQFINKATGQQIINDFAERGGTDNIFSGTYTGKGNTAYRVMFDDKGNPYFYTTGGSSNDLVNLLGDDPILNAVAQIGASYFGGPWGSAALNTAMGKDVKDIAKSYVLSQLGQEAFKGLTTTGAEQNLFGETGANFAKDIKDVFGKTGSDILGKTAGSYIATGGNVDIGNLLVNQGVGAATNAVLGEIPGFDDLNATEKKFVTNIVTSTLNDGKLSTNEAVSAAIAYGRQAAQTSGKGVTKVADAGEDLFKLPGGVQLASADSGTMSDAGNGFDIGTITRAPIFAESKGSDQVEVPFGSRLMSATEETESIDPNTGRTVFTKPEGAYYDAVSNAWFVREDLDKVLNTGTVGADLALFRQSQGDLDKIASQTKSTSDDYMADFLKSIGINSVDDLVSKNLSNQDILDLINAPKDDDGIPELDIKGKRIDGTVGELDTTKKDDDVKKDDEIDELVIKDDKEKGCLPGFHDDGTGLCVADDDTKKNNECPEGYVRDLETGQCVLPTKTPPIKCGEGFKLSADGKSCVPIVKTTGPIKCTEGFELSADGKSCVPIKKKTTEETYPAKGQATPSQDPYANIKLMEELFGGDIAYKLRSLGATQNLASADIDALERLLRG
jgi:hypothetical protein